MVLISSTARLGGKSQPPSRSVGHIRRARTLWADDQHDRAYEDLTAILETSDVAVEQKMVARLQRAKWLLEHGDREAALLDLEAVTASGRNFPSVLDEASDLLSGQEAG